MISQLAAAPNLITLLRLVFIPFICIAIVEKRFVVAVALLVMAGVSDALDGLLARWLKQRTTLGQYLDPIADKLLLSTMFLVLSGTGLLAWRITILVFARDIAILLVSAVLYMTTSLRDFSPSIYGKANTVAQILTVLVVLFDEVSHAPWVGLLETLGVWSVMALTVLSSLHYIALINRRLRTATAR